MAKTSPDPHPRASMDQRWRPVGTGATMMIVGRGVSAACGLLQVPIILAHLGSDGLGLWIALVGLLWSLAILDWGVGFAVQNRVTTLLASRREGEAVALVRSAFRTLVLSGLITAGIGVSFAFLGTWNDWFGVNDAALRGETPIAMAIVFGFAALLVPLSLASRIAAAVQHMWLTGLWTAVGSVLGLAAVTAAGQLDLMLPGFVLAGCVMPLALYLGTWLQLRRRLAWLRADSAAASGTRFKLWRDSLLFFMPQLGACFISTFVPTLVMLFAGPLAAASFGVLQRLYSVVLQLQNMAIGPAWPAYTQAAAVGDAAFSRRMFRATWLLTALGFVLPVLILTPAVPAFIGVWLGAGAPAIPPSLLWLMTGWYALQFCGMPIAMILNGVGRIGSLVFAGWVSIAGGLALCAVLGPRWGAEGVVIALAGPYALLGLPITGWQAWHVLAGIEPRRPEAA